MYGITPRQKRVYVALCDYVSKHDGIAPTIRELQAAAGFSSTSEIHVALDELQWRGWIERLPSKARAIRIVGPTKPDLKNDPAPAHEAAVAPDVTRLVVAARAVAYDEIDPETIRELDQAAEAFASRVPWEDEPNDLETESAYLPAKGVHL